MMAVEASEMSAAPGDEAFVNEAEHISFEEAFTDEVAQDQVDDKVVDLIEYLVCSLVEDVDGISLDVTDGESSVLVEISCSPNDIGRVIGRKGRTIKAIRTLARALGQRVGTSVEVEVLG